ncbi:MAG: non-ribosomal peptide synthetase, partial [bacterium]|nr:non-ribosomal peptide synthetase [bacterium]
APLLRVGTLTRSNGGIILMVDMNHIITDGTSQEILAREFFQMYTGKELPKLRLQYKDYAQWRSSREQQQLMEKQEEYWLRTLSGELPVLELPTDYPRPAVQDFDGENVRFQLNNAETRRIKETAADINATLYMTLLSVFTIMLAKISGKEDVIIGAPVAGRRHADLEKIIGMFVNTLALRNYPEGTKTFESYLKEVKARTLEVYENQDYQFEDLVDKLSIPRDMGRNPVFDIEFNHLNMGEAGKAADGKETKVWKEDDETQQPGEYIKPSVKFDLVLTAWEPQPGEAMTFQMGYATKLFKRETIQRLVGYFKKIAAEAVNKPGKEIGTMEIINEKERRRLLEEFNQTAVDYPKDKTLHQMLEE